MKDVNDFFPEKEPKVEELDKRSLTGITSPVSISSVVESETEREAPKSDGLLNALKAIQITLVKQSKEEQEVFEAFKEQQQAQHKELLSTLGASSIQNISESIKSDNTTSFFNDFVNKSKNVFGLGKKSIRKDVQKIVKTKDTNNFWNRTEKELQTLNDVSNKEVSLSSKENSVASVISSNILEIRNLLKNSLVKTSETNKSDYLRSVETAKEDKTSEEVLSTISDWIMYDSKRESETQLERISELVKANVNENIIQTNTLTTATAPEEKKKGLFDNITSSVSSIFSKESLSKLAPTVLGFLGPAIGVGLAGLAGWMLGSWIYDKIDLYLADAIDWVVKGVDDLVKSVSQFFEDIAKKWEEVKEKVSKFWNDTKTAVADAWEATKTGATDVWNKTETVAFDAIDSVKKTASDTWDKTETVAFDAIDSVKKTASDTYNTVANNVTETLGLSKKQTETKIKEVTQLQKAVNPVAFDNNVLSKGPMNFTSKETLKVEPKTVSKNVPEVGIPQGVIPDKESIKALQAAGLSSYQIDNIYRSTDTLKVEPKTEILKETLKTVEPKTVIPQGVIPDKESIKALQDAGLSSYQIDNIYRSTETNGLNTSKQSVFSNSANSSLSTLFQKKPEVSIENTSIKNSKEEHNQLFPKLTTSRTLELSKQIMVAREQNHSVEPIIIPMPPPSVVVNSPSNISPGIAPRLDPSSISALMAQNILAFA